MPCNSDHMRPTPEEEYRQRTAMLLWWVLNSLGRETGRNLLHDSKDIYCKPDYTDSLCNLLKNLPKAQIDHLVYNGRSRTSRDLANWWEDHQANDKRRESAKKADKQKKKLIASAMSKLTLEERKALGL